ncbi:OmpW/AlkL family protein [Lichenibacterium ramalinae]|uniref:OmpW family protein n=1 Tax=Lichenibacterium ramalinae TaxID=2316527 RepID=A0A4Q2RHJ8_9HYPH|nr:OmpW family outer membrane protein [Lichenibacterium ramalinae]RYB06138.1 hypothetical protein D3272_06915 [Lichenibacterium ramalinae]
MVHIERRSRTRRGDLCRTALIACAIALPSSGGAADLPAPSPARSPAAVAPQPAAPPLEGGLTAGSFLVRGRIIGAIPVDQRSRIDLIGGRIVTPARALPDLDVSYFMTDHFAVAAQFGIVPTRTSIRNSLLGNFPVGTVWSASTTAALQYHLLPLSTFNPYVGVGVGATVPLAYQPARPLVTAIKSDPQVGPMIQVGLDYHLGGNWYANAELKQIFLPVQVAHVGPVSATVKLDMLIVGAGLGYRF